MLIETCILMCPSLSEVNDRGSSGRALKTYPLNSADYNIKFIQSHLSCHVYITHYCIHTVLLFIWVLVATHNTVAFPTMNWANSINIHTTSSILMDQQSLKGRPVLPLFVSGGMDLLPSLQGHGDCHAPQWRWSHLARQENPETSLKQRYLLWTL